MKRKALLFSAAAVVFSAGIVTFAKQSGSFASFFDLRPDAMVNGTAIKNTVPDNTLSASEGAKEPVIVETDSASLCGSITDETAFDMFFIKLVSLERAAAKARSRGESGNVWSNYLKREGFTDNEIAVVRRIAQDYAAEIAPIHAKALEIIRSGRQTLAKTGHLPLPPPELRKLQDQRGKVTIRNIRRMEGLLGPEAVEKAKALMKSRSTAVPVDRSELISSEERKELFRQKISDLSQKKEGNDND